MSNIKKEIIVKIYCGESIEVKCKHQLHPINEVKSAIKLLETGKDIITYSNSPDFIITIKYCCEEMGIKPEFFLNDVSQGSNIENIFDDFNRSFKLLDKTVELIKVR